MSLQKILIVEDEPDMALGLQDNFEYEGYEVVVARDGEEGVQFANAEKPDIIILDVMLPKMSGLDVCRHLRGEGLKTPIIMLTARSQEMDKVIGLEIGADDYVTKPFGIRELLARIRARLRNTSQTNSEIESYSFADISINFKKYQATKSGSPLDLSTREFELLKYLVKHRGEAVTRDQLLDDIWGIEDYPFTRTVDNHISKLRQKIEGDSSNPKYIITVHRIGYKFLG